MRKNSNAILKEIYLEHNLKNFEHANRLNQCLDDMLNFRVNELDALDEAFALVKDNEILREYVREKTIEHTRKLIQVLGVTVEGFRISIEELEEGRRKYEQIRNGIKQQIHTKSKETMH